MKGDPAFDNRWIVELINIPRTGANPTFKVSGPCVVNAQGLGKPFTRFGEWTTMPMTGGELFILTGATLSESGAVALSLTPGSLGLRNKASRMQMSLDEAHESLQGFTAWLSEIIEAQGERAWAAVEQENEIRQRDRELMERRHRDKFAREAKSKGCDWGAF